MDDVDDVDDVDEVDGMDTGNGNSVVPGGTPSGSARQPRDESRDSCLSPWRAAESASEETALAVLRRRRWRWRCQLGGGTSPLWNGRLGPFDKLRAGEAFLRE